MEYCIYHSKDLDGLTSGAIVYSHQKRFGEDCTLVGYDYGEKLDTRKFKGRSVVMIDVSMEMERMEILGHSALEFMWIDHHVSAWNNLMQYCKEKGYEVKEKELNSLVTMYEVPRMNMIYYYSPILSGCEISTLIFNKGLEEGQLKLIKILGQYDTWRDTDEKKMVSDSDWDSVVMPIQYFMRTLSDPKEIYNLFQRLNSWNETHISFKEILRIGKYVLKYQKNLNEQSIKKYFEFELNGLKIIAVNTNIFNSHLFDGYFHPEIHDAMMPFSYNGKTEKWIFSLYTTKEDVDILSVAKNMNGGGHKKACGFQLPMEMVHFEENKIVFGVKKTIDGLKHKVSDPITPELFRDKPSKKGHIHRELSGEDYLIPNVFVKKFDLLSEKSPEQIKEEYKKYIVEP